MSIDGVALKVNAAIDFETLPILSLRVRTTDQVGLWSEQILSLSTLDLPEMLDSPLIGDSSEQKSSITDITLTFDGPVELSEGAFELVQLGSPVPQVDLTPATSVNSLGQTEIKLTFSGDKTRNALGALKDGYYQLTIDGTKITRSGVALDMNGDGTTGDTLIIGDEQTDEFFSLYGDSNGDGLVGIAEFGEFRSLFGTLDTEVNYDPIWDYDGLGIGVSDFGMFRARFGKPRIAWPS